jgi:hypothetical protein
MLRNSLIGSGILAILFGLVWMGQGSGYFPYPAASFMIDNRPWIGYGAALAVVGIFLVIAGRKRG